jgi:glutamate N-acetyltransferase/amino-acid N-acetyltransferase
MKEFKFAGIKAGIKKNGKKDLGVIYCEKPAAAAALFTRNRVVAAPVILGRKKLEQGLCQAVLVNSGNANCFTGDQGLKDAQECAKMLGAALNIHENLVLTSSTGVIGAYLPMDKFESAVPRAAACLDADNLRDFADAILTTDTCVKISEQTCMVGRTRVSVTGVAKGSGMIRPDMATMLAFICTDADVTSSGLKRALSEACEKSFNRITVDGDTSTNDTVLALASGASGIRIDNDAAWKMFQGMIDRVCVDLAEKIVKDGEGATKLVRITVKGAATAQDAFRASEAIAHSNLVKTAVNGEDPNWGRITAAAGRSGASVVTEKMDLFFENLPLVIKGIWQGPEAEKKAALIMKKDEIDITLDLNLGDFADSFLFCDFSADYVRINADYRS